MNESCFIVGLMQGIVRKQVKAKESQNVMNFDRGPHSVQGVLT